MNKRRGRTQNGRGAPIEVHGHMPASEQADEDSEEPMSAEETSEEEEQAKQCMKRGRERGWMRERGRCEVQAGILGTSRLAPFVVAEFCS